MALALKGLIKARNFISRTAVSYTHLTLPTICSVEECILTKWNCILNADSTKTHFSSFTF